MPITTTRHSEGGQDDIVVTKNDSPAISTPQNTGIHDNIEDQGDSEPQIITTYIRKLSQQVQDLLERRGTWTNRTKAQKVFPGI